MIEDEDDSADRVINDIIVDVWEAFYFHSAFPKLNKVGLFPLLQLKKHIFPFLMIEGFTNNDNQHICFYKFKLNHENPSKSEIIAKSYYGPFKERVMSSLCIRQVKMQEVLDNAFVLNTNEVRQHRDIIIIPGREAMVAFDRGRMVEIG